MDWTKAKTILIVALLITNTFLIVLYITSKNDVSSTDETLLAETIAILEEKQIFVRSELPEEHSKMAVLFVEYDQVDNDFINSKLLEQMFAHEKEKPEGSAGEIAENFIKSCNLWTSGTILDRIHEHDGKTLVSYRNEFEGIPIEGSYIKCTIEDGKVIDIDRVWFNPIRLGKSKKATISASAALIDLMRSKDAGESIVVENMEMVYWLDFSDYAEETTISDTALPAWRITYNDGQIRHVPAYSE